MELINFDQICRICWKSDNLRTVFNEDIPSLCEMLMACTPIEVCEENGLPTKLCEDCGLELKTAFTFRTKCITSEIKFKKYLLDHGIETTVQYVHNPETDETIETIHTTVAIKAGEQIPLINNPNNPLIMNNLSETCQTSHNVIQSNETNEDSSLVDDSTTEFKEENLEKSEENRLVIKKHSCNQCKRAYSHPRNLKRHIKEHHNGMIRKSQTGSRDLRCCICRKIFSFRNALIRHLRVIHHNITQKCFKTVKGKKCCTSQINIFIENIHENTKQEKGIFGDINISDDEFTTVSSRQNIQLNLQNEAEIKNKENFEVKPDNETVENKNMLDISNEIFLGSVDSILKEHDNVQMFQDDNQTVFIVEESLFNKIAVVAKNATQSEEIIEEEGVEYKCQLCENIFTSLTGLKDHIKISHIIDENDDLVEKNDLSTEDIDYDDDMNAKLVTSENEIEVINENGERKIKYSCKLCDRSYNAKNNLHRHIKDKHLPKTSEPIRQYKCEMCGRGFARKGLLERHRESHLERVAFQCEQCGEVFDKKKKLRLHVIKHETQKKFQCDVCNKWFLRATTLKVHKKQHASILPFPCPECDRAFSMRPALEAHVRTHSETRPYVCNICRRAFRHPGHLDTHLKLHTGERPYSCTMCEKRFTTSTHLKYHIKVHLDQRDFKCEICGRAFIHSTELKYHMISHSQIKERPCPICGKLFARTNQVTKHLKQVHHVTKNFYAH